MELETQLVIRSIGYQVKPVPGLPFDERAGHVPNDMGRVLSRVPNPNEPTEVCRFLFCVVETMMGSLIHPIFD